MFLNNWCYTNINYGICGFITGLDRPEILESERKLLILTKMATNPECIEFILRGLYLHNQEIIELSDQATESVHRGVAHLLNQVVEVCKTLIYQ